MKSKNFRKMMNLFPSLRELKYDSPEYQRLYRQFNRINKQADQFFSENDNDKNFHLLKKYILAIYLYDEVHYTFKPAPASFIISRLFYTESHKRYYTLTVPISEMSFFLTFFSHDSEISQLLQPVIFSDKQKEELEKLIQNEEINFRERFKILREIIE